MMRKTVQRSLLAAAALCLAVSLLSACEKREEEATTTDPQTTYSFPSLPSFPAVKIGSFSVTEYRNQIAAAKDFFFAAPLDTAYSDPQYLFENAGKLWERIVTNPSLRGHMSASNRKVYADEAGDALLVVGETWKQPLIETGTCYIILQKSSGAVLAAWVEMEANQ
ncbi:MAG: hypothetical protein LBC83_04455 [Oscillospiraceae bacterium]|jgi:hypothetical protein|nr:hypothetical protein [Oscillospiraceae bacterium]